jgi:hypothetical protein
MRQCWDTSGVSGVASLSRRISRRHTRVSAHASVACGLPCPLGCDVQVSRVPVCSWAAGISPGVISIFFNFSSLDSNKLQTSKNCRDLNSSQKIVK